MDAGLTPLWISIRTSLLATIITFFLGIGTAYLVANYKGCLLYTSDAADD